MGLGFVDRQIQKKKKKIMDKIHQEKLYLYGHCPPRKIIFVKYQIWTIVNGLRKQDIH